MSFIQKLEKLGKCQRLSRELCGGVNGGNAWMFKRRNAFKGDTAFRYALRSVAGADAVIEELHKLLELKGLLDKKLDENGVK
jgi:hypothetical protein